CKWQHHSEKLSVNSRVGFFGVVQMAAPFRRMTEFVHKAHVGAQLEPNIRLVQFKQLILGTSYTQSMVYVSTRTSTDRVGENVTGRNPKSGLFRISDRDLRKEVQMTSY
ncbi:hypothetical protein Pfo_006072, partial [Paulownia fortunei]